MSIAKKKGKMTIRQGERIRVLPKLQVKDEIQTLLIMENLDKVENPQYKDWLIKKLRIFYPDAMERLCPNEKTSNKKVKNLD